MGLDGGFNPVALLEQFNRNLWGITEFWRLRGIDPSGGYLTTFDRDGASGPEMVKTLVAQTRILWTYAALAQHLADDELLAIAARGVDYLVRTFHDDANGGWYWAVDGDTPKDASKLMYGESFALYALATYAAVSGEPRATELAIETFDAMHRAVDASHGGFWENLDRAWSPEETPSGRRKSLDIHLHLLESFTVLAELTGDPTHLRRLAEVRELLLSRMIDPASGVGGNQYLADFTPVEPIIIDRTWIAERTGDGAGASGRFTTSYGHNLELCWLLGRADLLLDGRATIHADLVDHVATHTLRYGFDPEYGGVYREGPPLGEATDKDKEFWQNAEALIGFLHAYQLTGKSEYADAFTRTWSFASRYLIHPQLHEWRIRTARSGRMVDDALGNQWTGGYHTVRAAIECTQRLSALARP